MLNLTTCSEFVSFESHLPRIASSGILAVAGFSLLLVLSTSYGCFFASVSDAKIHQLGGFSIINAWTFFIKRYDFLRTNFDKTGHNLFSFRVVQVSLGCSCECRNANRHFSTKSSRCPVKKLDRLSTTSRVWISARDIGC
jgi:hypothetical protein